MNNGFAVEHLLKKMKKSDVIAISQINDFKREAQTFIRSMLTTLFERSSLGFLILKSAAIFDPTKLRELPKEKSHSNVQPPLNLKLFLMKTLKCFVQILMVFCKIVCD